jgi:hypothetical protein
VNLFSRIIVGFGAFLIATGVIYGVVTYEWEGTTLMLIVAGGALLVGAYLMSAVQRARAALAARPATAPPGGAEAEPHVGPTIWPLVFALSAIGLVVGAVGPRWALLGGGVLFIAAGVGWILDIRQQWRHHDGAEPHEETHDLTGEPHHG